MPIDDVLYVSAGQKYVTLRHRGGRELIDESLRALEQELREAKFHAFRPPEEP